MPLFSLGSVILLTLDAQQYKRVQICTGRMSGYDCGKKKGRFYVTERYNVAPTITKFHTRPVVFNPGCPCESLQVLKKT